MGTQGVGRLRSYLRHPKWVVDGVHCDATGLWSNTLPAVAASFTDFDEVGFGVAYCADGGTTINRYAPHFTAG
jgi:hypothetical protein